MKRQHTISPMLKLRRTLCCFLLSLLANSFGQAPVSSIDQGEKKEPSIEDIIAALDNLESQLSKESEITVPAETQKPSALTPVPPGKLSPPVIVKPPVVKSIPPVPSARPSIDQKPTIPPSAEPPADSVPPPPVAVTPPPPSKSEPVPPKTDRSEVKQSLVPTPPESKAVTTGFSWRESYLLGPGDTLKCRVYGRPDLTRESLTIMPDGTLSYLSAAGITIAGLSIQDARKEIQRALQIDYPNSRVVLIPVTLASKQYVILGKVRNGGMYSMDHPTSLLEAIAQGGGIATGIINFQTRELADFGRSFIVRNNQRLPVDFESLYLKGDLSQNVQLEPDDYIYLASAIDNEYYVFGAVQRPGSQIFDPGSTVVSALSRQFGFADGAWRKRVLLIRGSLDQPQATIVDVDRILSGKASDVLLKPQDIIYVHTEPWYTTAKLLDSAIVAFLQSASSTYIDLNVSTPTEQQ